TYKLSFRYTPTDSLLLRGSLGTGFRAPTVYDIANPIADAGVTAARYGCPFTAPDPLAAGCNGNAQYSKREGGNPLSNDGALKPERSKQWSLGFRVDALKSLSLGLDLWSVSIRDKIAVVTEEQAFNNAALYRPLFSVVTNKIGNYPDVALTTSPLNLTNAEYSGIDWDESFKTKTDYGTLTAAFTGTYMLKSRATAAGSNEWKSNLGRFENGNVTFRTIAHLSASLKSGMFTHTAQLNYRSGYNDQRFEAADQIVRRVNADGSYGAWVDYNGSVASYTTLDWQTSAELNKWLKLTFGIKNLADRAPPFVARNGGANQRGYDGRYSDPLGRQFYLTGSVKF
ncbi:TonB-dependent receptor domain-containing protein, partial [Chitinimonas sp.]|uniref:TonB-dependent receptor domain-containing protein n=1 Tax=Chitinimonas sp. TaxID=1934313 RepID=UPI0035AD8D14